MNVMATAERQPYLALDDQDSSGDCREPERLVDLSHTQDRHNKLLKLSLALNALLLVLCIFTTTLPVLHIFFTGTRNLELHGSLGHGEISDPYSPANAIIEYEYKEVIANDTRFTGRPGRLWEDSMTELMSGTLIRISEDEVRLHGTSSIALKDGGYAAGLGVAHNLHCVKKIKKFIYWDHFYPDLSPIGEEFEYIQEHADHCLDFLRQSILCNIDFSLYTLFWGERRGGLPTHSLPTIQKCVNWDVLQKWMRERQASTDMLIKP